MKIRRFIGKDMNEAMIKVKSELGIDAVILNSRKIKQPGFLGIFKKSVIEVVAAIDKEYKINTKLDRERKIKKEVEVVKEVKVEKQSNEIDNKIDKLTRIVENLESKVSSINQVPVDQSLNKVSETIIKDKTEKFIDLLIESSVDRKIAERVMKQVGRRISIDTNSDQTVINAIKIVINEFLGKPEIIETDYKKRKIFLFVGPTGVGKTTTLAKLAAKLSLIENKKIALITSDTYRIAAVEQLKTYSEILGVPLNVIYEASELEEALVDFEDMDYVLIDTAGRNYKDKTLKNELDSMIEYIENPEVFLVLSLVADYKNMVNVIESYKFIEDYKVIFTKFDEAVTFGNILNIKLFADKKLSYIANGQSVPDDIEVLNISHVADVIVGDK